MNIPYVFKRCTKCGEYKAANAEYFSKAKRGKFGLESRCKVCASREAKERARNRKYKKIKINSNEIFLIYEKDVYYRKNAETEKYEIAKRCTKCREIKLATTEYFYEKKRGKFGLSPICKIDEKEEANKRMKIWQKNNPERRKEISTKWYKNNKELTKERAKEWHANNIEKSRECKRKSAKKAYDKYPEKFRELARVFRKNNPEYQKEYYQSQQGQIVKFNSKCRRRAKEQNQGNGITKEQWLECMNFFGWKCAYSGEPLNKGNRSLDHITPLNSGGDNEIWNLVPMYRNYNSSKQDKEMVEWYKEQPFYSEDRLKKIYEWKEYAYNKYHKEVVNCTI